jgi:hypothetical protein
MISTLFTYFDTMIKNTDVSGISSSSAHSVVVSSSRRTPNSELENLFDDDEGDSQVNTYAGTQTVSHDVYITHMLSEWMSQNCDPDLMVKELVAFQLEAKGKNETLMDKPFQHGKIILNLLYELIKF